MRSRGLDRTVLLVYESFFDIGEANMPEAWWGRTVSISFSERRCVGGKAWSPLPSFPSSLV